MEFDDMWVRGEAANGLNFAQVVDLVQGVEVSLHALDGEVLASFDALGLEHFAECAFPFLGDESIF